MFSLWIVGRNGGLLYSKARTTPTLLLPHLLRHSLTAPHCQPQDFKALPPIEFNDKLRLASSWFGMCGISGQVSPVPDGTGIQLMQADTFDLHSFHTLTGTTFMAVTEPHTPEAAEVLRSTYVIPSLELLLNQPAGG